MYTLKKLIIDLLLIHKGGIIMNKRQIFTVIFGRENVSDEELWNAGYGDAGIKIEVAPENISNYIQYKRQFLLEQTLRGIKYIKTSWVELPEKQAEQIDVVMKLIAYAVLSLNGYCVTVRNMTKTTETYLHKLGYVVRGGYQGGWIDMYEAYKSSLGEGYLTAEIAKQTLNLINALILQKFLAEKKNDKLQFVIIPTFSIQVEATNDKGLANDVLEKLGLEFDSDTLIKMHDGQPLTLIDLRNFNIVKEMQMPDFEIFKKYLTK